MWIYGANQENLAMSGKNLDNVKDKIYIYIHIYIIIYIHIYIYRKPGFHHQYKGRGRGRAYIAAPTNSGTQGGREGKVAIGHKHIKPVQEK